MTAARALAMVVMAAALAASGCTSAGAAQAASWADATGARAVVLGIIAADNARDLGRALDFYADDAVLMPPNEPPVHGKAQIRARYERLFRDYAPQFTGDVDDVHAGSDWAVAVGTLQGQLAPASGGEARAVHDEYMMLLSRATDGTWHIARLMWHPDTPAASEH